MSAPVAAVSVLLPQAGRVLFVRRGHAPRAWAWALPGGRLRAGEDPVQAARRELREEAGLEGAPRGQLGWVSVREGAHHFLLWVLLWEARGRPRAGSDARAWAWLEAAELAGPEVEPCSAQVARAWLAGTASVAPLPAWSCPGSSAGGGRPL